MAIWICSIKKMTILMEHLSDLSIQKVSDSQIASVAGEFCWGTFTHITEKQLQDGASVQPQVLPPSRRRSSGPAKKPLVHGEFEDYMDYTGKQRFVLLVLIIILQLQTYFNEPSPCIWRFVLGLRFRDGLLHELGISRRTSKGRWSVVVGTTQVFSILKIYYNIWLYIYVIMYIYIYI